MTDQSGPGSTTSVHAKSVGGPVPFLKRLLYPQWLRHLITEQDNETLDVKRVIALAGVGEFLYLGIHSVVINHSPFDANSFAMGLAAILAATGAMLGLAKGTERAK